MSERLPVAVVGATGYLGAELLRLLCRHPRVEITLVGSETFRGRPVDEVLPNLKGSLSLPCESFDVDSCWERAETFFLAMQNGRAMEIVPRLLERGRQVIDLSADYRLKDPALYPTWYKLEHASPGLLAEAVYGIPELAGDKLLGARLIANPGCFPTGILLALAPLLRSGWADPRGIAISSATGVSGAGRSQFTLEHHFPEADENVHAYGLGGHRHRPEIEQEASRLAGEEVRISFVPHLTPMIRGIHSTLFVPLRRAASQEELDGLFQQAYADARFVHPLPGGQAPHTKSVWGSNHCQMSVVPDPHAGRAIVLAVEDNLVKGGAGQAVQCLNRAQGWDEADGLDFPGLYP